MSLGACIPGMVERGEISKEKGDEMASLYGELHRDYRRQYGDQVAAAMASEETLKVLERQALLSKRRTLLQMRAQMGALKAREAYRGRPNDPAWVAALLDRDGNAPYSNVEGRRKAVARRAYASMDGVLAKFRRDLAGRVRNRAELVDVVRELFGEDTGNLSARELAQGFASAAEMLRGRFNSAGGAIAKLERWGMPQAHDSDKVRMAAGKGKTLEENFAAWRDAILPGLDRARMVDPRTGRAFSDEALELALRDVFETIRTEGWAKRNPAAAGRGAMAGRHSEHRFLIFKSADDWLAYQDRFGRGTPFDAMVGHVEGMARDIAAMEILGPNPEATIRWLKDRVEKDGALVQDDGEAGRKAANAATKVQSLWNEYTGANRRPGSEALANVGSALRAWETASKLGSAVLAAVPGDLGTQRLTAKFNGLPFTKVLENYLKLLDPTNEEHRLFAIRLAGGAEGWANMNAATMRAFNSEMTKEWASRLSEGTLRASGMGRWTDAGRWAQQLTMFGHMSDMAGRSFDQLDPAFRRLFERYGIGADGWDIIRATKQRQHKGAGWIFPEDIADSNLGDRVLEMSATETDLAVPVADLETRAMFHELGRPGTVPGEIIRNSLLFKSFGVAMLLTHGRRIMQMSSWRQRASYGFNAAIALTMGGALTLQMKEIAKGRDPMPMDNWAFWGAAIAQGGGFGMIGDLAELVADPRMSSWAKYIAGPVADTAQGLSEFGAAAVKRAFNIRSKTGKPANVGAKGIALLQREVPGGSLWYARAAFQRLLLDRLSEAADPNYRQSWRRMEKRAREQRTGYWWGPGDTAPARLPDFENGLGAAQMGAEP